MFEPAKQYYIKLLQFANDVLLLYTTVTILIAEVLLSAKYEKQPLCWRLLQLGSIALCV